MTKLKDILFDGIILFVASTALVLAADFGFSRLKKLSKEENPLVASIERNDLDGLRGNLVHSNQPDSRGRTPLAWAAYANLKTPETLVETDRKRAEMIIVLLANGADPNAPDKDGWTPLMWAAWSGLGNCADVLVNNGARCDVHDKQGQSALTLAASRGFPAIVRIILRKNPSGRDKAREAAASALPHHPAEKEAYEEILRLLDNDR